VTFATFAARQVMCMRFAALLLLFLLATSAEPADAASRCTLGRLAELPVTMAEELKLPRHPAPPGFYIRGVGGSSTTPQVAVVENFTFAGVQFHRVDFLVGGNELGTGVGLLGQNLLRIADTEFDLANGVIRLFKPKSCGDQNLAYWAASVPVGVVELHCARQQC